jgi:hypothetical protein
MSKSLTVPPPMEVTNAMIRTPKGSSLLCIAANEPEIEKATVPNVSMVCMVLISISCAD